MHLCYTSSRYFPILPSLSFLPSKWRLPRHKFAKKFTFKKSEEIFIVERSAFRSPTEIRQDFIEESFWPQGKQLEAPHQNAFYRIIKHFKGSGGMTRRGQTKEDRCMAVTPENIKRVDNYFTADSKSSICTMSYYLGSRVVVDPLDIFRSDCHVSVFLGLASSGHTSWIFKALDDAVEEVSVRGLKLFSLWPKELLMKSCWISFGDRKALLSTIKISWDFLKINFFCKFVAWEPSFW